MRASRFGWLAVIFLAPGMALAQGRARAAESPMRFVLDTATAEARYLVRERFAAATIDNDVTGRTRAVTGSVVLGADGVPVPGESHVRIDLTTLKTDKPRRDSYVQKNTLETAKWPVADFTVTAVKGLPSRLTPTSGSMELVVTGNLTLHGVTRAVSWTGKATAFDDGLRGTVRTTIRFADFGMAVPRVPIVARVDDPITLELDFTFVHVVEPAL